MSGEEAGPVGVFVGLTTLDLIQHVERIPSPNTKASATWQELSAGGPALNAAVTFAALGATATLLTRIGSGPVADLVRDDLERRRVRVIDLATGAYSPSVSAIAVEAGRGSRQIISTDAGRVEHAAERLPAAAEHALRGADIVLVDGHHPDIAELALASLPAAPGPERTPVVLDAGRWKPQMTRLLPRCTDVICSADFRLEGETAGAAMLRELLRRGAGLAAISDGPQPIRWQLAGDAAGLQHTEVPALRGHALDTLGAGDVLHGAYAWARAAGRPLTRDAARRHLAFAATVASLSCRHRGTRSWLAELPDEREEKA